MVVFKKGKFLPEEHHIKLSCNFASSKLFKKKSDAHFLMQEILIGWILSI